MKHLSRILFVSAAVMFGFALAQFPERPVTYTIPFNPGGESDTTARFQEPHLEEILGTDVVVNHKPGGGGAVGWGEFQRSARPTGYELIGVNIPHIIGQPLLRNNAGYETDGFEIITWFHFTPNALIVRADSEFETLEDLIAFAQENPEVVTVGGSGTFSANHLETLRLENEGDLDVTYIPFTGTGPLVPAIIGGHVSAGMSYTPVGVQQSEQVRVLAVAAEERVAALPDVPTFRELGYDIVGGAYRGVAAPEGTPEEVIAVLEDAFARTNEIIGEQQEPLGFVMTNFTGQEAVELVEQVGKNYGPVLEQAQQQ